MSRKNVRNNLPVVEVFVRVFGAVVVSVEQFADFRTPEKGMAKRGHEYILGFVWYPIGFIHCGVITDPPPTPLFVFG